MLLKPGKLLIVGVLCSSLLLTGCGAKDVFEDPNAKYTLETYSNTNLKAEKYYVKDGSKFYMAYEADGSDSCLWLGRDTTLVPSTYKGGQLAIATKNSSLSNLSLQRYKYDGFSIGVYGATIDSEGYICLDAKNNTIKGSSAYAVFKEAKSDEIRIEKINGTPVSESSLTEAGCLTGMEKDGVYEISFFAGSFYYTQQITADYELLEEYETVSLDDAVNSKNGYLAINFPDSLKSGYYAIDDCLFRYYAYERGDLQDDEQNMNEANYGSGEVTKYANSQQYTLNVKTKTSDVGFYVAYESDKYADEDVRCILCAPDGTEYNMPAANGTAFVELAEVMAGRWTINVMPKALKVDIKVENTRNQEDALCEESEYTFEEDESNIMFYASYEGDGTVWGVVTSDTGASQTFDVDSKTKQLSTTFPYLSAGTYKVTIYHYLDTQIKEVNYQKDDENMETDVIIIEE